MLPLGFLERFCLSIRARCSGPDRACGLGDRAWIAPCRLRVGSCVICRPGYLILGRINPWEEFDPSGEFEFSSESIIGRVQSRAFCIKVVLDGVIRPV